MYSFEILDFALSDLDEIVEFISYELNNPDYATKTYDLIKSKIETLDTSPERCEPYPFESKNPKYPSPDLYIYRKLLVGYYIVLYVVDYKKKKIIIVRVFDGRSDYQNKI